MDTWDCNNSIYYINGVVHVLAVVYVTISYHAARCIFNLFLGSRHIYKSYFHLLEASLLIIGISSGNYLWCVFYTFVFIFVLICTDDILRDVSYLEVWLPPLIVFMALGYTWDKGQALKGYENVTFVNIS